MPNLKPVTWLGDSQERLRNFPKVARSELGFQLELVQGGETPDDFRPMADVGPGTMEIRVHSENEYRVFYVARFKEAVYVLHCFVKKTQKTRQAEISLGRQRYHAMLERRKDEGYSG